MGGKTMKTSFNRSGLVITLEKCEEIMLTTPVGEEKKIRLRIRESDGMVVITDNTGLIKK
ncbi:MAG: hypothetical protein WC517_01455 [Patescibacteria group bacterium]